MKHGLATVIVAALAAVALSASAGQVKVAPVVTDGRVVASFTAADAWSVEVKDLLRLGQLVTFAYDVELRRPSVLWDSTLAHTNVTTSAKLDTLTGGYQVSRYRDGKVVKADRRDQENDVRDWLTASEPVELQSDTPLKANTDYYVQVRLFRTPKQNSSLLSILPLGRDDMSGRTTFTYVR